MEAPFLGQGWGFPPAFDRNTGQVDTVAGREDIEHSLSLLLGTRPGERLLHPRFGCNLDALLFESVTVTLLTSIKDQIKTAIVLYEPRIDLLRLNIDESGMPEGRILIEVDYQIRTTNSRFNFVYPFYLNEKTDSI